MADQQVQSIVQASLIEALVQGDAGKSTINTSSFVRTALRTVAFAGLDCPIQKKVSLMELADQKKIDDLYLTVSKADFKPFEFFQMLRAAIGIEEGYDLSNHEATEIADLMLKLHDEGHAPAAIRPRLEGLAAEASR